MIEVIKAERRHCGIIGTYMRPGDLKECIDMGFESGTAAARHAFDNHTENYTALDECGWPIAMWGCRPEAGIVSDKAYLWCMTTRQVELHKKDILKLSRDFVHRMQNKYRLLESSVAPEYEASVRWLHWLGFQIAGTEMYKGHAYYRVVRERGL